MRRAAQIATVTVLAFALTACAGTLSPDESESTTSSVPEITEESQGEEATQPEATLPSDIGLVVTTPVDVSEFRDHMRWYPRGDVEPLGEASVCAEYIAAATGFPFPLPEGYGFPLEPPIQPFPGQAEIDCEADSGTEYEGSVGLGAAILFWEGATATAAVAAHQRGDEDMALDYVDGVEAGMLIDLVELYRPAGNEGLASYQPVEDARNDDWHALTQVAEWFLQEPTNAAIAAAAGDELQ